MSSESFWLDTDSSWQQLDLIPDRVAARNREAELCSEPMHVIHVGDRGVKRLEPMSFLWRLPRRSVAA